MVKVPIFHFFFSASLQQQSFLMARSSDEDAAPWQGGGRVVSSDRNPAVMAGTHSIYNRKGIYPDKFICGYLWHIDSSLWLSMMEWTYTRLMKAHGDFSGEEKPSRTRHGGLDRWENHGTIDGLFSHCHVGVSEGNFKKILTGFVSSQVELSWIIWDVRR